MTEPNKIDDLPGGRVDWDPHRMHERGVVTPARFAQISGYSTKTIYEKITIGEIPSTLVLGKPRIEALVAWAARQGVEGQALHDVADAIRARKTPDEIIALVDSLLKAKPKQPKGRKPRNKKPTATTAGE